MTLSILQKIQLLVIRSVMLVLWAFDLLSFVFSKSFYLRAVRALALASLALYLGFFAYGKISAGNYSKDLSVLHTGLVAEINSAPIASSSSVFGDQVLGASSRTAKQPVLTENIAFPYVSAKAHLVIDNSSQKILSEHNLNRAFAPASTTKLMTALVALDLYSMDEKVSIPLDCTSIDSTKLWLPAGSVFYFKDLMHGLLVSSAGDVACALASSKVDQASFVELMNEKASSLKMDNTHFTNPIGLDGENGSHYSSVWDLYLLSQKAMSNSFIRDIVKTELYSFASAEDESLKVNIENTNKLLSEIPGTIGIKTGRTTGAGEVLMYRYDKDGKDITIVVMSSEDRFSDTQKLLDWTLETYSWQ